MLSDVGGGGVIECSGRPILIVFILINENWISPMTRLHAEPNILLSRNLSFHSDVRQ